MRRRPDLAFRAKTLLAALALGFFTATRAGSYDDYFRAVNVDNDRTVKALLQRGFDPNAVSEAGQTGLYLAMRDESPKVALALLADARTQVDAANLAGETPLMMAALRNHLDWVQRLLERGASINRDGWTPLHYAATGADPEVAALLVQRGAALESLSPNGTTPLMMAARYGSERTVDQLLALGASLNARNDQGLTAVDFARLGGRDHLARRLAAASR
jgi:ankyrin repeat protein